MDELCGALAQSGAPLERLSMRVVSRRGNDNAGNGRDTPPAIAPKHLAALAALPSDMRVGR